MSRYLDQLLDHDMTCNVVELSLATDNGQPLNLKALVVPFICNPVTSQPISLSGETYEHLIDLELAS